jgi:hypothetical protein
MRSAIVFSYIIFFPLQFRATFALWDKMETKSLSQAAYVRSRYGLHGRAHTHLWQSRSKTLKLNEPKGPVARLQDS